MKPTVLVDQDGPLSDFNGYFFQRCVEEGIEFDCAYEEQTHRIALDHIQDREQRRFARRMVEQPGWFLELPVVQGAQAGMEELASVADVWICTKPLEANPTCRDDKAHWILEHFGSGWEQRVIIAPNKSLVWGDILLDDGPKLAWLDIASWSPMIFPLSFNGLGSEWAHIPSWTWGERIERLLPEWWTP